ncbi:MULTISPECIES: tRNA lysidine(34) synthetase TilS [Brachybacterium]|uniref:tRNA(Ile)-lysidine synthase n=1 Tax=Brachybacterium alimentarium TaxID=47845 RepID=A0A2A3YJV6_9MICO|nr:MULTISPECIES: tRNA lysidine(34) synthetase TilS [Brachybacterium]PCC31540.1 tRNA lysidine(34) synthetase TilS [Brachybacterium alimentarium]PCC39626.1 tRNA lysidine(34) synthetase TilS [Brachybacterium alimentarium]RCS65105.1 tRNA lysidine(34) synthetase TilS [Brachybacterium sp. JB7]RCS69718.1 tRNA lysidine(34) synthetase TilS [Brachybacterium alimentarium]RCS76564.1 tRNA lysidine(34) synthetase TilS [Brachybacterium alimentarium]
MAGPPPVVARGRTAVRGALAQRLETLADDTAVGRLAPRVVVGLSGGADSLALLATTVWVASRMGLECEAAIVDHGLQDESSSVAERARAQAERLGATAHVLRVGVDPDAPGGLENAARDARHAALDALLEDRGALALLLGHTLDDQAEQVLMGLARGAGPRALAGIPRSRDALLRPFLGTGRDESTALRREDTEEICRLHDLEWWEDPMNADESMLRARVRHRALPLLREVLGEQVDVNLARTADLLRPDVDHLDAEAHDLLDSLVRDGGEQREEEDLLLLDVHALAVAPAALRTRVLRDASRRARHLCEEETERAGSTKSLLRRQVLTIDALVVSWHGQAAVPVPGRIEVARRDGLLVWRRTDP